MCGIVGFATTEKRITPEALASACAAIAHRGPDDSGTICFEVEGTIPVQIGLGNRRLAILDLSPLGHQPMPDPKTGNWIAYNGEVYNFRDLRERLQAEGAQFLSHSDTEVLLRAYAHWGEKFLTELRGMFAFALWDAQRQRLLLARDPMGIKPLYFQQTQGQLLFASEVRALLRFGLTPRRLDAAGLENYLAFGSACDPVTLIEGVGALAPGECLSWERGRIERREYWRLPVPAAAEMLGESERSTAAIQLRDLLFESVRMQMVSDVPVGVFLSGGIDSSAVVAILAASGIRPSTFSVTFRESGLSEAQFSNAIAKRFQTDHHEILVSADDALRMVPEALAAMDQPTMDGINTYLVSGQTRAAGIKVALSGLGGDELFAGYSSFRLVPKLMQLSRVLEVLPTRLRGAAAKAALASSLLGKGDRARKIAALIGGMDGLAHPYFLSRMLFTSREQNRLRLPSWIDAESSVRASASMNQLARVVQPLDAVNQVSYLESRWYMLNILLRDSDGMSMAHGLEVRVPLMDHHLAGLLALMPGAWKLDPKPLKMPKPLLVRALGDLLPAEVVYRRKQGFTLPFAQWMREELRGEMEQSLAAIPHGPLAEWLSPRGVQDVWQSFLRGQTYWSRPWSLFVLQRWCEKNL